MASSLRASIHYTKAELGIHLAYISLNRRVRDEVTLSDVVTVSLTKNIAESIELSEAIVIDTATLVTLIDGFSLSDTVATVTNYEKVFTEYLPVTDADRGTFALNGAPLNTTLLGNADYVYIPNIDITTGKGVTETIFVIEATPLITGGSNTVDTVSVVDVATTTTAFVRVFNETITVSDIASNDADTSVGGLPIFNGAMLNSQMLN